MSFFDHAVSIAREAVPPTPLDRLAAEMLSHSHGMQARVRPVIEAARLEPREAAIQRLRISAKNLNRWAAMGTNAAADAMKRDGTNAIEIALIADAISTAADELERR